MDKTTVITKSYEGNEWVKSFAQSGIPQINQQIFSPWELYKESILSFGVKIKALPIEKPIGIFIMLRILRENSGGYFQSRSYKDAEIAYQAIQSLRMQYVGPIENEIEGISKLLSPGILRQKNEAIIEELLKPYLRELKTLNLWDMPSLYQDFIQEISKHAVTWTGKMILIEEDPLSPLELAFVNSVRPDNNIEHLSRDVLFSHKPFNKPGKKEIFKAYGSYNEWREVLDRIIQNGDAYDQFVIGSPQAKRIAHFMKEQSIVPYTLACGFETPNTHIELGRQKRLKQAIKAGFLEEELPTIEQEIQDSLLNNRSNLEHSQSGKIHLTEINLLPIIQRKNVYLMGAEVYTGNQMENPILLDGDILALREKEELSDLMTSREKTRKTIRDFHWTVDFMIKQNRNVTISYSYYDTAQLKIQAKPSTISTFEETFIRGEDAGYFSNNRIPLTELEANGLLYYTGRGYGLSRVDNQEEAGLGELEALSISATKAESLTECPYKFALEILLGMEITEELGDITRWLDPMQMGSLCHEIFADFHKETQETYTLEDNKTLMKRIYKQVVNSWLRAIKPKVDPYRELEEIQTITDKYVILKNEFGKNNLVAAEYPFGEKEIIPQKLLIHGKADLIEEGSEGLLVLDVKTGRRIKQVDHDVKSCIQAILYCLLLEQETPELPVAGGYYLYPRTNRVVVCDYNPIVKERALELLSRRLNSLETGENWKANGEDICAYCSMKTICQEKNKRRLFHRMVEEGIIS